MKPWSDFVEVYWSEHAEAYVTPVSEDLVGVAILYYRDRLPRPKNQSRFESLLKLFPELEAQVREKSVASSPRGAGPFERRASKHVVHRCMLIGDAAGYLDPLTGEGIRLGLDAGEAAIQCILKDQPHKYEQAWRKVSRRYWVMTDGLLRIRQVPLLRRLMIPVLKRIPWLFDRIITLLAAPAH
jgi:flavin-dependent dehydrogenase